MEYTGGIMKNILIVLGLLVALLIGFVVGRLNIPTPINTVVDTAIDTTQEQTGTQVTNTGATATIPAAEQAGAVSVGAKLSAGQRTMLTSFGINPDTFVITPTMVACAEAKIGTARMTEIQNGETPSLKEGASLVACYK